MNKKLSVWLFFSAIVMLFLPWMASEFAEPSAGMLITIILFFAVNPLYSVLVGFYAGKAPKTLWKAPVISAVLFLVGTWLFFDMGEKTFLVYSAAYLAIGTISMMISFVIIKKSASDSQRNIQK